MRFLGVAETCDLASLYLRLMAEGHEAKLCISYALAQGTLVESRPTSTAARRG